MFGQDAQYLYSSAVLGLALIYALRCLFNVQALLTGEMLIILHELFGYSLVVLLGNCYATEKDRVLLLLQYSVYLGPLHSKLGQHTI